MSRLPLPAPALLAVLVGLIVLILCGVTLLTNRLSARLNRVAIPRLWALTAGSFVQVLAGAGTALALRAAGWGPAPALAAGLGVLIVLGLPLMRWAGGGSWKQALRLWAAAAGLQIVLIPIVGAILALAGVALVMWIFPPVY